MAHLFSSYFEIFRDQFWSLYQVTKNRYPILIIVKFQLIFDSFYPEGVECGKFLLIGNPT